MKSCLFCKRPLSEGVRAKEHIIPAWLQSEWNLAGLVYEPTHFSETGEILSSRKHNLGSFLAGRVCESCNSGWMAALESQAKPLILSLSSGRRKVIDLDNTEALVLARWTVKTCFVLHASSNYRMLVKPDHFSVLDQTDFRLPEGTYVLGHTYSSGKDFRWIQTPMTQVFLRDCNITQQDRQLLKQSGYRIALKLGGLYVMTFHNPLAGSRACLWFRRHIPLYPRWSHPVTWQKLDKAWPSDSVRRFFTFIATLGISMEASEPAAGDYRLEDKAKSQR